MTYEESKTRINNAITTSRKWPNVVSVSDKYEDQYGIYFMDKDVFIINSGVDRELQELYDEDEKLVEKIVLELEAGRFKLNKSM